MTESQKVVYLIHEGRKCPYCESENLYDHRISNGRSDSATLSMPILCEDCGKAWNDIYTLTDVQ